LPLVAVDRLLKAPKAGTARGRRNRAILGLMALHGLRVCEVARLDLGSVDLEARTAVLRGKGSKQRTVLLVGRSCALLRSWLEARPHVAAAGEMALFVSLHPPRPGTRMDRRTLRAMTDKHLRALGLKRPGVSCHALRHSFATLARASGAGQELERRGEVPTYHEPVARWASALFGSYAAIGFLALAAYGGSLLQVNLLPAWAGWVTIVFSIAMLILFLVQGDTLPAFHYCPPLLIGILLITLG
jgi:hypothetical protein